MARYNHTVAFHKLLTHLDFQRIMSRLVGDRRKEWVVEIAAGYNQGVQHGQWEYNMYCVGFFFEKFTHSTKCFKQCNFVCENLASRLLLAEKKTFRREKNMLKDVISCNVKKILAIFMLGKFNNFGSRNFSLRFSENFQHFECKVQLEIATAACHSRCGLNAWQENKIKQTLKIIYRPFHCGHTPQVLSFLKKT